LMPATFREGRAARPALSHAPAPRVFRWPRTPGTVHADPEMSRSIPTAPNTAAGRCSSSLSTAAAPNQRTVRCCSSIRDSGCDGRVMRRREDPATGAHGDPADSHQVCTSCPKTGRRRVQIHAIWEFGRPNGRLVVPTHTGCEFGTLARESGGPGRPGEGARKGPRRGRGSVDTRA